MRSNQAPQINNEKFLQWCSTHTNDFLPMLERAKGVQVYLPWKKERHKAPGGCPPEAWWSLLQMGRDLKVVSQELKSTSGEHFVLSTFFEIQSLLHEIDLNSGVTELPQLSPAQKRSPEKAYRKYLIRHTLEEAIASSQMEGASTTRAVARKMLIEKRAPKDRSEQMIFNNFNTINKLNEWKDEPLSEELLFRIHRSITEETLEDEKQGRYRTVADDIVVADTFGKTIYIPPSAELLPERVAKLIDFANQPEIVNGRFLHPVLKAVLLHTLLAYEHPFCDGNGRTARALFSWSLLRDNYWQTAYVSVSRELMKNRNAYDNAYIDMEECHFDTTYNVLVNLRAFRDALQSLNQYMTKTLSNVSVARDRIGDKFNPRQFDLLEHSLRHPDYVYKPAEHAKWHNITLNTARSDMQGLQAEGYLSQDFQGRAQVFRSTGLFLTQSEV